MKILETHGALAEYILIQDRYAKAKQLLEDAKRGSNQQNILKIVKAT